MDRQLPRNFIALLQNWLDIAYVMLVFAGEARYHIGIWHCVTAGVS